MRVVCLKKRVEKRRKQRHEFHGLTQINSATIVQSVSKFLLQILLEKNFFRAQGQFHEKC